MRCLDLFSGIGGFALGLESVGMHTIGFCEIEPFPRAVLAHHWPGVPIHDDVRTLSAESVPWLRAEAARGIDLICGGFPCQDISVAGKGAGLAGARSGLWGECSRLVGELRPRWALFENVGALKQRGIDRVCADLEGHGYAVWPLLVGAGIGVGAPHRRDRVWIVGHRLEESNRTGGGTANRDAGDEGRRSATRGAAIPQRGTAPVSHVRATGRDRAKDSAVGLADGNRPGQPVERRSQLQHGVGAAQRDDADGRGERPVGEPDGARATTGLSGEERSDEEGNAEEPDNAGCGCDVPDPEGERRAQQGHWRDGGSRLRCDGPRWPARPGEPQHEWEEPRLAYGPSGTVRGTGQPRESANPGSPEQPLGSAVDGLPVGLVSDLAARHGLSEAFVAEWWTRNRLKVERAHNREGLKAYGNAVVPQVVRIVGQAILEADEALR